MNNDEIKRFALGLLTLQRAPLARDYLLAELRTHRTITPEMARYACAHGLSALLPQEMREQRDTVYTTLPATAIADYLHLFSSYCLHLTVQSTGTYTQLVLGTHKPEPHRTCIPVDQKRAQRAISHLLTQTQSAFALALAIDDKIMPIRALRLYPSGSVAIECYGFNRVFPLLRKDESGEKHK